VRLSIFKNLIQLTTNQPRSKKMSILKNAQFLKIALALHSSRRRKATVGNIIQIGGDLRCREFQTQVSVFSFFDFDYLVQLFFLRCQSIFNTNRVF
jgi:hypothetical protein